LRFLKFSQDRSAKNGQALPIVLIIMALISILILAMSTQYSNNLKSSYWRVDRELYRTNLKSAIDTFNVLYRLTLTRYSDFVKDCSIARDFSRALSEGHGCSTAGTFI
jgi:hypothetical protein